MTRLLRLLADRRGVTAIEFGMVAPVLMLLVIGSMELVHMKYVETVLVGQLQKAGRDFSLEGSASTDAQTAVEQAVTTAVKRIAPGATVTYTVASFHDYVNAASPAEEFVDTNSDGICDNGETFVDSNGNGVWDANGSVNGRGGAKDVVMLTARLSYPRPGLGWMFGGSRTMTMSATTILRNQPSTAQSQPATGTCP